MPKQAQFYLKREWEATWETFQQICIREGGRGEAGRKIMGWITDYVAVHSDGNPQTILDFAGEVKTLPRYKTCIHSGKKKAGGVFGCSLDKPRRGHRAGLFPIIRCNRCEFYEVIKGSVTDD
jgi:hypothetical protein